MEEREPKLEDFEKYLTTIKTFFKNQNDIIFNDYFHFTYKEEDFKLVLTDKNTLSIKKAMPFFDEKNLCYGTLKFILDKKNITILCNSDYFEWSDVLINDVKEHYVKEVINIPNPTELEKIAEDEFNESITDGLKEMMSKQEIRFWKMGFLSGFLKNK